MKIYTASSWKNEERVKMLADMLRAWGHDVYCFAEQGAGQHIFDWSDIITPDDDGITCLDNDDSLRAFLVDKAWLDWSNCCVLLNPCGRDAHLEAGYIKGRGGKLYILGSFPKGEFSNMYHLADGLVRSTDEYSINWLQKELKTGSNNVVDPANKIKELEEDIRQRKMKAQYYLMQGDSGGL